MRVPRCDAYLLQERIEQNPIREEIDQLTVRIPQIFIEGLRRPMTGIATPGADALPVAIDRAVPWPRPPFGSLNFREILVARHLSPGDDDEDVSWFGTLLVKNSLESRNGAPHNSAV